MPRAIDLIRRTRSRRELGRLLRTVGIGTVAMTLPWIPARAAEEKLIYYTWAGYDSAGLHKVYKARHGDYPDFTLFADETEALMKVRGGFVVDISHPCIYDIIRWRDAGVISPIDSTRLAEWDNLFPALKAVAGDRESGLPLMVPFDWGNGSILYRHDMLELSEASWSVFFNEKYDKRLSMWDSADAAVTVAALASGAHDPFDMNDEEFAIVRALLKKQNSMLLYYWSDPTQIEQSLAAGEIGGAYAWNSAYMNLRRQGVPVTYMQPKEGMLTWFCGMVLMRDRTVSDATCYEFMDAMLAPETGLWLIETYGYGHANANSFKLAGPDLTAQMALPSDPIAMFANSIVLPPMQPDVRQRYIAMFEESKITF